MSGEPSEPIKPVSDESKQAGGESKQANDEPVESADTPPEETNMIPSEPKAATTLGSYIVVGMIYFTMFIAIITLPYVNGMLVTVYFFILFILLIGMTEVDQSARTALLGQLTIIYILLFALQYIEFRGTVTLHNIEQLTRYIITILFVFLIPFILPYSIDFVNWLITREL
jgi:K+-sensing histidine kinase KdpD